MRFIYAESPARLVALQLWSRKRFAGTGEAFGVNLCDFVVPEPFVNCEEPLGCGEVLWVCCNPPPRVAGTVGPLV